MTGTALALWMLCGLAPAQPAGIDESLDRDALLFAEWLAVTSENIAAQYVRPVRPNDLVLAGLTELYDVAGRKLPAHFRDKAGAALATDDRLRVAYQARLALGAVESVTGMKAVLTATDGLSKVTDPYCGLMVTRGGFLATSEAEFGLGFELEGATGPDWLLYHLELARGGKPESPGKHPWTVSRVISGSPAAANGIRVGDVIAQVNDSPVTPRSRHTLFRQLALPSSPSDIAGLPEFVPKELKLIVTRPGTAQPIPITLTRTGYTPETITGVTRRENGTWDWFLDPDAKIGYIRVGAVEDGADIAFREALAELVRGGAAGLVLDLRWCPGGGVTPIYGIAQSLLPPGKIVAKFEYRDPVANSGTDLPVTRSGDHPEEWDQLPVAVLVGPDTVGGGEMIAAALQDHGRAVVVGQRTFGKANLMVAFGTRFPGVSFRITTGYSLRPNGKPRHRFPDSKPTDPWGVRPDPGYEVPMTPDLSTRLREQAERHAARPPRDTGAVELDDPLADPQRLIAAKLLRERLRQ